MSFTSEVRQELLSVQEGSLREQTTCLAAILSCIGNDVPDAEGRDGRCGIWIRTGNIAALTKCFTLIQKVAKIKIKLFEGLSSGGIRLSDCCDGASADRIERCVCPADEDRRRRIEDPLPSSMLGSMLCRRSYLRGMFLCAGQISDPENEYRLEFLFRSQKQAQQLQNVWSSLLRETTDTGRSGDILRISHRRNQSVVYTRSSARIVDTLNLLGAPVAQMKMENSRIVHRMRDNVNRKVNCETSNIRKTVEAAAQQQKAIRYLMERPEFEKLPENLQEMAHLRMENEELSLKELGELADPPISKSGVSHRLQKLMKAAADLQGCE